MTAAAQAAEPRLDTARVGAWLADALPAFAGMLKARRYTGGYSNLTWALDTPGGTLVLRHPPPGPRPRSGHDMGREYRVLAALGGRVPWVPEVLALCEDESVIGAPFYLMREVPGPIVRREYPAGLAPTPALVRAQQERLIDVLAQLHQLDYAAFGLADLGRPEGYLDRQLAGWSRRYRAAATPDAPDLDAVASWLDRHRPPPHGRHALIHNDYKLDNVVWDAGEPTRLRAVLDWEMATLGDPLLDLGCMLAYWVQADDPPALLATRMLPTHLPGSLRREEVAKRYARASGLAPEPLAWYYAFGLFRLAGILQQLYHRWWRGDSADPRFAGLAAGVQAVAGALRAITG